MLAASEHLVITYSGADEVSGRVRPPAVPLGELIDSVELMAPGSRSTIEVHHPLQPFDARNFTPGRLGGDAVFSFDTAARAAAMAAGVRAATRLVWPTWSSPRHLPRTSTSPRWVPSCVRRPRSSCDEDWA